MNCARSLAAVLLCVATTAAQSAVVEIHWDGSQSLEQSLVVPAQSSTELCGRLRAGTQVTWRFESSAPASFNVHYHQGKEIVYAAKEDSTSGLPGTVDVQSDQSFCWMWSNKTAAPISVKAWLSKKP